MHAPVTLIPFKTRSVALAQVLKRFCYQHNRRRPPTHVSSCCLSWPSRSSTVLRFTVHLEFASFSVSWILTTLLPMLKSDATDFRIFDIFTSNESHCQTMADVLKASIYTLVPRSAAYVAHNAGWSALCVTFRTILVSNQNRQKNEWKTQTHMGGKCNGSNGYEKCYNALACTTYW